MIFRFARQTLLKGKKKNESKGNRKEAIPISASSQSDVSGPSVGKRNPSTFSMFFAHAFAPTQFLQYEIQ